MWLALHCTRSFGLDGEGEGETVQLRRVRCAMPRWKTGCTLPPGPGGQLNNASGGALARAVPLHWPRRSPSCIAELQTRRALLSAMLCVRQHAAFTPSAPEQRAQMHAQKRCAGMDRICSRAVQVLWPSDCLAAVVSARIDKPMRAKLMPRDPAAGQQARTHQPAQSNPRQCSPALGNGICAKGAGCRGGGGCGQPETSLLDVVHLEGPTAGAWPFPIRSDRQRKHGVSTANATLFQGLLPLRWRRPLQKCRAS